MQFLAAVRENELAACDDKEKKETRSHLRVLANFNDLLGKVADKARISPLGNVFHDWIYPPLSLISHQSYGNIEFEASSFSDEPLSDDAGRVKQLGTWLNCITAALVFRVRNEIGLESFVGAAD